MTAVTYKTNFTTIEELEKLQSTDMFDNFSTVEQVNQRGRKLQSYQDTNDFSFLGKDEDVRTIIARDWKTLNSYQMSHEKISFIINNFCQMENFWRKQTGGGIFTGRIVVEGSNKTHTMSMMHWNAGSKPSFKDWIKELQQHAAKLGADKPGYPFLGIYNEEQYRSGLTDPFGEKSWQHTISVVNVRTGAQMTISKMAVEHLKHQKFFGGSNGGGNASLSSRIDPVKFLQLIEHPALAKASSETATAAAAADTKTAAAAPQVAGSTAAEGTEPNKATMK